MTFIRARMPGFALALLAGGHCLAASTESVAWKKVEDQVIAHVNWCLASGSKLCRGAPSGFNDIKPQINSNSVVSVEVSSFNYINYDIEYAITDKKIEVYAQLSQLWDQLLGIDLNATVTQSQSASVKAPPIEEWWNELRKTREALGTDVAKYIAHTGLDSDQIGEIKKLHEKYADALGSLDKKRADAFKAASTEEDLQKFSIVDKDHTTVVEAATAMVAFIQKCVNGDRKVIGSRDSGTFVTVSLSAIPRAPTEAVPAAQTVSTDYLVESNHPLLFHGGLAYSDLKDVKFDTVRNLEGRDLFAKIRDEKGTKSLSAFLSMPLDGKPLDEARFFFTLGTDVENLGDNIYIGASFRFLSRVLVTAGGVYGLEKTGEGEVTDTDNSGNETRTLYEMAKEDRKLGFFTSLSVKLY